MGFFYSLGINFDDLESAQTCKSKMISYKIQLSDLSIVDKTISIYKSKLTGGKIQYQVQIFPDGLQYVTGNKKLASPAFFYEIRSRLYEFLLSSVFYYNYAFFEFEGADYFLDVDIAAYLNIHGIGKIKEGDDNAASIAQYVATDFTSKRFLDGLVLSNILYKELENKSDFQKFNDNYMWLPVRL